MSKTKNYYWDEAEKKSDKIIDQYVKNEIKYDDAVNQLSNVEGLALTGIDENNVDEVLFIAKEDYYKKSNEMGGLQ